MNRFLAIPRLPARFARGVASLPWRTFHASDYVRPAEPFAFRHLWPTAAMLPFDFWGYRRQLQTIERYREAAV